LRLSLGNERVHVIELSDKTARQLYSEIEAKPRRAALWLRTQSALVTIELNTACTAVGAFATAYEIDPNVHINQLAELARAKGLLVVSTRCGGVWGRRSDASDSLQNIEVGSRPAGM
jgi:hypothetical protein